MLCSTLWKRNRWCLRLTVIPFMSTNQPCQHVCSTRWKDIRSTHPRTNSPTPTHLRLLVNSPTWAIWFDHHHVPCMLQIVRLHYVLHYPIFYNECALSCAIQWSLILARYLHFILTGFEKGHFVNNDLSSSLRKSIRERRWHALHTNNIHFDTIRVICVTWRMLVASASFCF